MERVRVRFTGRVQGVGFRATCRGLAAGCTVTGWVRNEPDGSVVLEVQGDRAELDRLLERISSRRGPDIVAREETSAALVAEELGFAIRR